MGNLGPYEAFSRLAKQNGGVNNTLNAIAQKGFDLGSKNQLKAGIVTGVIGSVVVALFAEAMGALRNSKIRTEAEQKLKDADRKLAEAEQKLAEAKRLAEEPEGEK